MLDIVTIARTWIGTPYVHQAARRGAGCDCLGLLRGVWAEASGAPLEPVPPYTSDWSEPQGDEVLWQAVADRLIAKPRDVPQPGDVLLFRMRQGAVAKHVGLQANTGQHATFIHAYQGHGVRESTFSAPWKRRLVARFSTPERLQDKV
ncbi:putative gene transfer agent protein [Octadecabacter antarcticus 307]|uniref:Putative gene transfer agent protein n=1 Tax=Octadecabacter antarcticus 307 TaxID=391626 RepID=M9R9A6_9RHOB|nr:putative gene transfer agent protein [Octadecabacter antarcticus 307]